MERNKSKIKTITQGGKDKKNERIPKKFQIKKIRNSREANKNL